MTDVPAESGKPDKHRVADLVVLLILAGLTAIYGIDSYRASSHILNLILVLPVTVIVLALCAIQFATDVRRVREQGAAAEPIRGIVPVMALFAVYVATLEWLGFDVGTFLFIGTFLWLHGERRWQWIVGYALAFSMLMALFFSTMLPYPMPLLLIESAY